MYLLSWDDNNLLKDLRTAKGEGGFVILFFNAISKKKKITPKFNNVDSNRENVDLYTFLQAYSNGSKNEISLTLRV